MNVTIETRENTVTETPVDADYCYSQAAQALTRASTHMGSSVDDAREWRLLGDSLHQLQTSQPAA